MSEKIVLVKEKVIKRQLKELVRGSMEEILLPPENLTELTSP